MKKTIDLPISSLDAPLSSALNKVVSNSTRAGTKVLHQPAYILHSYPLSETSLVLDVLTREHGRLIIVAKGAKRPYTRWRASIFQTFQTLSLSFSGKNSVRTLLDAEWVGGIPMLQGAALMSGYYMNEWMRRALALDDAHPLLFDVYQHSLADLSLSTVAEHAAALRGFELALLRELGYGVPLTVAHGVIECDARYGLAVSAHEWVRIDTAQAPNDMHVIHGQTLLDLQRNQFHTAQTALESKHLLRFLLHHHIGERPLHTRNLLIELHQL